MWVNIGPSRVQLDTWDDIVTAAGEGFLDETAYCELKKDLPPKGQNEETGRDLASLTVLGGLMVVGIEDAGGRAGAVVGVPDADRRKQRLIGIAQGLVQPSMVCEVRTINKPGEDLGCVLCIVPPSAMAPHRASERYWGRSSEGKRVLSEPEVADLFARRRLHQDDFREHLHSLTGDFDPYPLDATRGARRRSGHGHSYFSARPLQPNPLGALPPWKHGEHILHLVARAGVQRISPWGGLDSVVHKVPHPFGIMGKSYADADLAHHKEYTLIHLLVRDDGTVDFASGLGTVDGKGGRRAVSVEGVIARVDECVRVTSQVAQEMALAGSWRIGVRLDGLHDTESLNAGYEMRLAAPVRYAEGDYEMVADFSSQELLDPPKVVQRLMRGFARGFGEDSVFPYTDLRTIFRRVR